MKQENVLHITISAMADVVGYGIENGKERSRRKNNPSNMIPLSVDILNEKVSINHIRNWLILTDGHMQIMLEKSDMYADIELITEMLINYKIVEVSGACCVVLKKPEQFPNIFCPETKADCLFACSKEAGLKFKALSNRT